MRHRPSKNFARAAAAALRHVPLGERPALLESAGRVAVTFRTTRERSPVPAVCPLATIRMQVLRSVSRGGAPSLLFTTHRLVLDPVLMVVESKPLRTYDLMLPPGAELVGPALDPDSQAPLALDGALLALALIDERPAMVDFTPEFWAAYPIEAPPVHEHTPALAELASEFGDGTTVEDLWRMGRRYFRKSNTGDWSESDEVDATADPDGAYVAYPLDFVSRSSPGSDQFVAHPWLVGHDGKPLPRPEDGLSAEGWHTEDGAPMPAAQRGEVLVRFASDHVGRSKALAAGCTTRNPAWWAMSSVGVVPAKAGLRAWDTMSRSWPQRLEFELRRRQGQLVAAVRAAYEAVGLGELSSRQAIEAMYDPASVVALPGRTRAHVLELGPDVTSRTVRGHGCVLELVEADLGPRAQPKEVYPQGSGRLVQASA